MYQTSGFVNHEMLTQIGRYFIPYQSRMVFRVCINLFVLLFFGFICVLKLLPAALMLAIAIFFVRSRSRAQKRCMEATMLRLRELSDSAQIRYSSKFNKNEIQAMNHTTNSRQNIPYAEIVEMVLKPDLYLLVSRKGELVFVFRSMLQDEEAFVSFLCSQRTKVSPLQKLRLKMLVKLTTQR